MKNQRVEAEKIYVTDIKKEGDIADLKDELFKAYKSGSIINHAIGYDLLRVASSEYNWKLNLSEISRVWTNGCIIRSGLMEDLVDIFENSNNHLLMNSDIISEIKEVRLV